MIETNSTEFTAKLNQAMEIIKKYYPGSSLSYSAEMYSHSEYGVAIQVRLIEVEEGVEEEEELSGYINIDFCQEAGQDDFDEELSPYELEAVSFRACCDVLDITYITTGGEDKCDGWEADSLNPSHIPEMCNEVFAALKDLRIYRQQSTPATR